jgi:N-methylhydantoinase B
VLKRAAFHRTSGSLDFSCVLFDAFAQAAIPVHLGSMAYAMADIVARFVWQADDLVLLNDP